MVKKTCLRWYFWFSIANMMLCWLIGLNYLSALPWVHSAFLTFKGKTLVSSFVLVSYLSHLALLSLMPASIIIPLIFILPKRKLILSASVFLATLVAGLLASDTVVYGLFHYHINGIILHLAGSPETLEQVFGFSRAEYFYGIMILVGLICIESSLAYGLWRFLQAERLIMRGMQKWIILFLAFCFYVSYTFIFYSAGTSINRIFTDVGRFLPYYTEGLGKLLPIKNGDLAIEQRAQEFFVQPDQVHATLHYPLQTLHYLPSEKLNLIVIVIDTWRFDMLNASVMPHLSQFAKRAWRFNHHISGGDATGPGVFSLFYGIPASYWTAAQLQQKGPVLIDELLRQQYQMGIFSSAELKLPAFHKTVLQAIKNVKVEGQAGDTPNERDSAVTQQFKKFVRENARHTQPFFSFLFYDSAHSYCQAPQTARQFEPAVKVCNRMSLGLNSDPVPYFNRYKNALFFIDQEINQVIQTLSAQHILDHTVIVITGDHGEEFNDNHLGYWGHASNFTAYQVQTPLIVYWPEKPAAVYTHQTSHFDIVPTLMTHLLGCQTPKASYSLGLDLRDKQTRPYLIVNSYIDFAILESNRITTIYPTGKFQVDQLNGQPLPKTTLNNKVMEKVFHDLRRFY